MVLRSLVITGRNYRLIWSLGIALVLIAVQGCQRPHPKSLEPIRLPWPDADYARYLQSHADSLHFQWFIDVKAAASAFMNEGNFTENPVSTADVVIIGEGMFHAKVEVRSPSKLYELTMERPFKELGTQSIWQVTKVEEKVWPENKSK